VTEWNPAQYAKNARYVAELGLPVVALLNPQKAERILDLGCGDGALTLELQKLGCAVVGVDASDKMVAAAQALGLNALTIDGQQLLFAEEFDAVFTNAALHWMKDHHAVANGAWRALKPGGRFVGEFGGHGNIQKIVTAIENALAARNIVIASPWHFPDTNKFRAVLESAGFVIEHMELFARPTPLPADLETWLGTFAKTWLAALPVAEQQPFMNEVSAELRSDLCDAHGQWTIDHVRLRFIATKPV